ncbi:hypothetical protein FHP05_01820 [Cerasibacillus terrae]|uniref:FeS cluster biogenesis domain-containing protein n=1 Tax=Cerasibacillus terrae TaxID=2498845 RepID=A0A5C8P2H9_9BACI|nr:HesB/YadR/YfhF family protein [Cerasibacillus terrae]TXL67781.1 hypothetical protein FHP05_01820 [Cerasibacillus terrae]
MNIQVNNMAAKWYKEELDMENSSFLRYFVRYGGKGHIPGFSLGIKQESPEYIHTSVKVNGITFFIEESDKWYFDGVDLLVDFDTKLNEPVFTYQPN